MQPGSRVVICAAILLILLTAADASATYSRPVAPPSLIKLMSVDTSEHPVDVAPKGPSLGDRDTGTAQLTNVQRQLGKPKGAVVGSDSYSIVQTGPKSFTAHVTAKLLGGQLFASGPLVLTAPTTHVRVIGGTGAFKHATGTLYFYDLPSRPAHKEIDVYRLAYH